MRWPLRNQILVRMLLLLLITIAAITFANIRSTIRINREAELGRLQQLVELAKTSVFPLTASVLEDMKSLSGAEFLLADNHGDVIAKTSAAPTGEFVVGSAAGDSEGQSTSQAIVVGGIPFYHSAVRNVYGRDRSPSAGLLHIFVPRQSEQSVWWQASKSPLTIALLVLPLALLLSLAMANQVTRPMANLKNQVQQIAEGNIQQMPEISVNDEIRDLNVSINEMATKLVDHDVQLRKNERLRTLVQFGSSIAHHLRNSATGCKMAIELLAGEHRSIAESDNYQVAVRQLGLMNNYIKKFLLLSKSPETTPNNDPQLIDLKPILENVIFLLSPSAKHLDVEMTVDSKCDESRIRISEEDAEQLMMNLIANGINAASQRIVRLVEGQPAIVAIRLRINDGRVAFSVSDNGEGPPPEIAEAIFQPFVTGSKEGTGLGLSLVSDISNRVGGSIRWIRENELTTFIFETPDQITTPTTVS